MHRNVQGFAPGGCKSLSCDAGRQRAAPAIICITNRGYSHVALTEIVCMDALFPPRIQALLRRATTLQKRPEGLRQRKISHSLILSSGSDMSHRDASVGMKFVGYSCWEVFFSPPQHALRWCTSAQIGCFPGTGINFGFRGPRFGCAEIKLSPRCTWKHQMRGGCCMCITFWHPCTESARSQARAT